MKCFRFTPPLAIALIVTLCLWPAFAKDKKGPQGKESNTTETTGAFNLKVPVNVVVVSAIVNDSHGKPVRDLSSEDFKVYEDGKLQPIHTFGRESYKPVQEPGKEQTSTTIPQEPESPVDQPHYVALMIDDLNAPADESLYRTVEAIKKYLSQNLNAEDLFAIASTSGNIQVPFTNDASALRDELDSLPKRLDRRKGLQTGCIEMTESQATLIDKYLSPGTIPRPFGSSTEAVSTYLNAGGCRFSSLLPEIQVAIVETIVCNHLEDGILAVQTAADWIHPIANAAVSEANYRHRLMLAGLRQYVRTLRHFEGRKSLILFSEGFVAEPLRYELQDVVDAALRSNVYVSAIDVRGLYVTGEMAASNFNIPKAGMIVNRIPSGGGITEERVPVSFAHIHSAKVQTGSNQQSGQNDPLNMLALETGGIFVHNNNDLYSGIRIAVDQQTFYYVLTYASPETKNDGRYHRIKVEVSRPGMKVRYREGYYAPREQITTERRKIEDIKEALLAPGNLNEIPIQLSYQFSQVSDTIYQVSLLTKVNVKGIEFLNEDERRKNSLNVMVAAYDERGKWIDGVEKEIDLNLLEPGYVAMLRYGFSAKVNLNLPPGHYKIRSVVRESLRSQMGSASRMIDVP
jgi:VWFA-related protein